MRNKRSINSMQDHMFRTMKNKHILPSHKVKPEMVQFKPADGAMVDIQKGGISKGNAVNRACHEHDAFSVDWA